MKYGAVIDRTNRIMEMMHGQVGDAVRVSVKDINTAIVLVVGADDRTLAKYQTLLLHLGYIKATEQLQIFGVQNWMLILPQKADMKNQLTLLSFAGDER